jgi:hypothetical protein
LKKPVTQLNDAELRIADVVPDPLPDIPIHPCGRPVSVTDAVWDVGQTSVVAARAAWPGVKAKLAASDAAEIKI